MVSCVREKCIYQWKTLQNSLDYQFSFAYRVVERMNADLASKNYYVILGRVATRYCRGQDLWSGTC